MIQINFNGVPFDCLETIDEVKNTGNGGLFDKFKSVKQMINHYRGKLVEHHYGQKKVTQIINKPTNCSYAYYGDYVVGSWIISGRPYDAYVTLYRACDLYRDKDTLDQMIFDKNSECNFFLKVINDNDEMEFYYVETDVD